MSTALSIRQLTKTYGNGFQALRALISMSPKATLLLGPARKSTTIGILSTLVNKSGGTVNVFGHDLIATRPAQAMPGRGAAGIQLQPVREGLRHPGHPGRVLRHSGEDRRASAPSATSTSWACGTSVTCPRACSPAA